MRLNTPFIFSHAPSQSPLNNAVNVSNNPRITSNTVPSVFEITLNAVSKTGARNSQNPSHTDFITSVISLKLNPSLLIRIVIPFENSSNFFLIPPHMDIM